MADQPRIVRVARAFPKSMGVRIWTREDTALGDRMVIVTMECNEAFRGLVGEVLRAAVEELKYERRAQNESAT